MGEVAVRLLRLNIFEVKKVAGDPAPTILEPTDYDGSPLDRSRLDIYGDIE